MASRIREWIERHKRGFTVAQADRGCHGASPGAIRSTIYEMAHRGELERTGDGRFRLIRILPPKKRAGSVRARLLKAMHLRGSFMVADVAMLADTTPKYAAVVACGLAKDGAIERVCRQRTRNGRMSWVYRVRHRDNFYRDYVQAFQSD